MPFMPPPTPALAHSEGQACSRRSRARTVLAFLLFHFSFLISASAWGPHGEITQAALDALAPDDALLRHLGTNAPKLVHYCWLGDYRRLPFERQGEFFYADDYLLFPGMERHLDHLVPEVKRAYEPYFRRALQALRTETPLNAARWIGSLLHFVEDTGSPPHSAEIRGDVHSKMENWLDAKLIHVPGYRPQLLGDTEEKALAGFLRRMDGLIAYSKERGDRCRPLVLSDKRADVEPIVLECALETSRVVADLLRTLGELYRKPPYKHDSIRGRVFSDGRPIRPTHGGPVRVLLLGTTHSTVADSEGDFEFTGLDEGDYKMVFLYPTLLAGITNVSTVREFDSLSYLPFFPTKLTTANLVRNPAFTACWLGKNLPDAWYPTKTAWEGDLIPLKDGSRYTLRLNWQDHPGAGDVVLRFRQNTNLGLPPVDAPFKPGTTDHVFTASDKLKWAQILIRTTNAPTTLLRSVAITPTP